MQFVWLISLLLLLFGSYTASADQQAFTLSSPLARELVAQHGLSQNIVTGMTEDQFGRVWIGTQDGVNVVDGNSIKLLSSVGKTPLSGKVVIDLKADHNNAVWVATTTGLNKVNSRDFSVSIVQYQQKPLLGIRKMVLLGAHHLALLVHRDLLFLDLISGEFTKDPWFAGQIEGTGVASDGMLIKTATGLFHYRLGKKPIKIAVPPELLAGSKQHLLHEQSLWMVTADLDLLTCQKGSCQPLQLPTVKDSVLSNLQMTLHQNQLYVLRHDDIIVYSFEHKTFRLIQPQLPIKSYTTTEVNSDIRVLRNGDIVTIRRQGLLITPDSYHNLKSYPQFSPLTGSKIYALTAIAEQNSGEELLLIATENRLELYKLTDHQPELVQQIPYPSQITPALFVRFHDMLLLSSLNGGIFSVDLVQGKLAKWQPQVFGLETLGTLIDSVALDNNHHLLLFHRRLVLLQQTPAGYQQLWSAALPTLKTARLIYKDQHLVIAAYQQGLFSSHWTDWSRPPAEWKISDAGNPMLDIRATANGQLQLLTAEKGVQLLQLHPQGTEITQLTDPTDLLNTTAVCSVGLSDDLWLAATHDGLALYNGNNQFIRQITLYDGLAQREFNQYQCGRLNDKAYFSGEQGLNLLGIAELAPAHQPALQLLQLLVDGTDTAVEQREVTVTEPQNITLHYSYAPYPLLAPLRFQYRLQPGNDEWFDTTATTLRYTQLSPGKYQLQLRAIQFDGVQSETVQLQLHIKPQLWRSAQAYVAYCLTVVLILWFYFRQRWQIQQAKLQVAESQRQFQLGYTDKLEEAVRLRTDKLEQQQQEFLLLQQEKIEFLTSTSHDLKNLSALIQLNLADLHQYLVPTGQASWQNVHTSCKLLNTLVDDILELSKLNAGVITPQLQTVNLSVLLQQVYQPFKLMAAERQIDLQLQLNEDLAVLTDPYLLSRLLMNLLDNALKNLSPGHTVQLELKKRYRTSRQVYLLVRDSGPGLPEHMRRHWGLAFQRGDSGYQGSGLGLSIVRKIAELLVLPVSLYSSERGTCFEMRLQQTQPQESPLIQGAGQAAIIESDPQSRQFLYYELVRRGFQVAVFHHAKDFARSGQRGFRVLISEIHFNASDDTIADLALLRSSLESNGKLIFVSADASVRSRLPDEAQFYFMVKPVKRSRLAWLLAKET